jgi:hypothetical protein
MKSKMLECQKTQNGNLKWKNGDQPLDWGVPFLQTNPSTFYLRMTIHPSTHITIPCHTKDVGVSENGAFTPHLRPSNDRDNDD